MRNEEKILLELKELREVIAKLVGTANQSTETQFSIEAIDKAALEFRKLSTERGEWLDTDQISKYLKGAFWGSAKFIVEKFQFTNYYKYKGQYYFNKESIISLSKALKEREVDIERYRHLCNEKAEFEKKVEATKIREASKKSKKPFIIPKDAKNITTSEPPKPSAEIIRADLKQLKTEFLDGKYGEYLDIYNGNYAMFKDAYRFNRWMDQEILKKLRKWTNNFNHANSVLTSITKKKEVFIPLPEDQILRL